MSSYYLGISLVRSGACIVGSVDGESGKNSGIPFHALKLALVVSSSV